MSEIPIKVSVGGNGDEFAHGDVRVDERVAASVSTDGQTVTVTVTNPNDPTDAVAIYDFEHPEEWPALEEDNDN